MKTKLLNFSVIKTVTTWDSQKPNQTKTNTFEICDKRHLEVAQYYIYKDFLPIGFIFHTSWKD